MFREISAALLWRRGFGVLGFCGVDISVVFKVCLFQFLIFVCKLIVLLFELLRIDIFFVYGKDVTTTYVIPIVGVLD